MDCIFFLDSGTQKFFIPIALSERLEQLWSRRVEAGTTASLPDSFRAIAPMVSTDAVKQVPNPQHGRCADAPYVWWRTGEMKWRIDGPEYTCYGLWVYVETNTAGADGNASIANNGGLRASDRGVVNATRALSDAENQAALSAANSNADPKAALVRIPYIEMVADQWKELTISGFAIGDVDHVQIRLGARTPQAKVRDVDIILDLGNTRTVGILFDHDAHGDATNQISASQLESAFTPLELKSELGVPAEESVRNGSSEIVSSWMVLHALDHQIYQKPQTAHPSPLLGRDVRDLRILEKREGLFRKIVKRVDPEAKVSELVPQMFCACSPVLLGDAARRQFFLPYAKNMSSIDGANFQQSSPKRYYWDDREMSGNWHMLLNEWDACYDDAPKDALSLPTVQGEMFRYIREDGRPLDLSNGLESVSADMRPSALPATPRYPRQSTLTWFLLHVLERAHSQINKTIDGTFVPRRLRKVLITYPSGWTDGEISRYRERCQEALDIFTTCNVYHGLQNTGERLEMVAREESPDEAVAGQLPFIFSEIERFRGIEASTWFSLVGKTRSGRSTVRAMNFDIGGGTTDLSIIEYADVAPVGTGYKRLSTTLLFKDGRTLAGDDLQKRIIEEVVLKPLVNEGGETGVAVRAVFGGAQNKTPRSVRSRLVRNCLIPLAQHCMAHSGEGMHTFTAAGVGISPQSWAEFNEALKKAGNGQNVDVDCQRQFQCTSSAVTDIVKEQFERLFDYCALYVAAYDVDLVVFSGKTSELPAVRELARRLVPLDENRLIFARSFKPGDWYPFRDENGCIEDAKTVTAVGAALYHALKCGRIKYWSIDGNPVTNVGGERNEWGVYSAMTGPRQSVFIDNHGKSTATVPLLLGSSIARRRNSSAEPEPVYKLLARNQDKYANVANDPFDVTLKRVGESLKIQEVSQGGNALPLEDFELKLWPCVDDGGFWQETGRFNI